MRKILAVLVAGCVGLIASCGNQELRTETDQYPKVCSQNLRVCQAEARSWMLSAILWPNVRPPWKFSSVIVDASSHGLVMTVSLRPPRLLPVSLIASQREAPSVGDHELSAKGRGYSAIKRRAKIRLAIYEHGGWTYQILSEENQLLPQRTVDRLLDSLR